jgi:putative membrane protein
MNDTSGKSGGRRAPVVFDPADPALIAEPAEPMPEPGALRAGGGKSRETAEQGEGGAAVPVGRSAFGWLGIMVSALLGLAALAAGVAFARFVSVVLERSDWIGIVGWSLLGLAFLALIVLALKELLGLVRLSRLAGLRREAEEAHRSRDAIAERRVVRRLRRVLSGRTDIAWGLARFAEHERDVHDPGELLALAEREIVAPLDAQAKRLILSSAKRVSLVTAMSPMAAIAVAFVLMENLRMLRGLATLYGGRPGMLGGMRLARMVFVHILATGGVALTDDLIGQFIGQDLARRLSRRLGEGLFNGALTARIGAAAAEVCRPLPYIEATPVRVRDILAELTRRQRPAREST